METTTTTTNATPLQRAAGLLAKNPDLWHELLPEEGMLVVNRAAGYPHPERTEQLVWESLPVELCDLLEAERLGGGTIALREVRS